MKIFRFILLIIPLFCFSKTGKIDQTKTVMIDDTSVGSWNHIKDKQDVYIGLNKPADKYQLKRIPNTSRLSPSYQVTLVKKLLDWNQQHSNGIDVSLDNLSLTFGQLAELKFNFKLSPANSVLVNNINLIGHSNPWLQNQPTYSDLISDKAHFILTFYGENHSDPRIKTLYAAFPFQLNFNTQSNPTNFNIKATDLNFYWQQDYQEETVAINAVEKMAIKGFIIVAESGNSKVVRNYIAESFPKKYTEIFNEFEITLSDIKISRKP